MRDPALRYHHQVLIPPHSPSPGVRVAFIVHAGAPVEFLELEVGHRERLPDRMEKGENP
jgi:hypothetical protein